MANRIQYIELDNFKGASNTTRIDFDTSKPAVMIFGENGTGKSTIIDAIDFICNQNLGSLDERSVPAHNRTVYMPTLGSSKSKLQVKLGYNNNEWIGALGTSSKPVCSGSNGKPSASILRRSQILKIVNGQPKTRFDEIKSFVQVPNCEDKEKALREAVKTTKINFEEATRATTQAYEALESLWMLEGKAGKDAINWAKSKTAIKKDELEEKVKILKKATTHVDQCENEYNSYNNSLTEYKSQKEKRDDSRNEFEESQEEEHNKPDMLIQVLQDSKKYIEANIDIENCPVCEQGIEPESLISKIDERLKAKEKQVSLKKALDIASNELQKKNTILEKNQQRFFELFINTAKFIKSNENIIDLPEIKWNEYPEVFKDQWGSSEEADKQLFSLYNMIFVNKENISQKYEDENQTLNQLNSITSHLDTIREKTISALRYSQILEKLNQLLETVEKERKVYIDEILAEISEKVEEIYLKVHPNEGLGSVRFYLDPKKPGSLEFEGQFQNSDVPPQAYYSESHLDTLGVCVFLALAQYYNNPDTIIILDDVITSVDQVHMQRFMQMLHDVVENFNQLIITTHYRPWRDRYRFASGPSANIQLIELLHWSLPRGIRHTKTKLIVDELKEYISDDNFDRQIIASKAGILLEGILDHIALLFKCKLPRQPEPNYNLGDLISSISKKLKKELQIQKYDSTQKMENKIHIDSLLIGIGELTWIRNKVGCHFNLSGLDVSDSDVKIFGERTVNFAETLICPNCGEIPGRDKSGSYWECKCKMTQLHPLQEPN